MTDLKEDLLPVATKQLSQSLIESVRGATFSVLSPIFDNNLIQGEINAPETTFEGIIGIISFVGNAAWSIALGLPPKVAIRMTEKFTGIEIEYTGADMGDMVGEFVNIIAGDIVARLDYLGIQAEMSLPTITRGLDIKMLFSEKLPLTQTHYTSAIGSFWVKIVIDEFQQHRPKDNWDAEAAAQPPEINKRFTMQTTEEQISTSYLTSVKQAVLTTFTSICEAEPVFQSEANNEITFDGVVGIISIVGQTKSWSLMIGFPPDSARNIAQKFAGFEIEYDSDDMGDVIGELVNVLAGDVVARLDGLGIKEEISLPTVTRGKKLHMLLSHDLKITTMNYSVPTGNFWLLLATGKKH